jgi:hypothetical protein
MIKKLDKRENTTIDFDPNEGERTLLSSNKGGMRSPSLGFLDTSSNDVTDDEILKYLAGILCDIYLSQTYDNHKKSSDLL